MFNPNNPIPHNGLELIRPANVGDYVESAIKNGFTVAAVFPTEFCHQVSDSCNYPNPKNSAEYWQVTMVGVSLFKQM